MDESKNKMSSKDKNSMYHLYETTKKLNYVHYVFTGSILFWIMNLPLLIGMLTIEISINNIFVIFLFSLPVGPAFTALLMALVNAKYNEKIISPFFKYYKMKFKKSITIWSSSLIIMCISIINFMFLSGSSFFSFLKWANLFIFVWIATFSINYILVITHFEISSIKKGIRLTFKLSILKSIQFGLSFMIIIGSLILLTVLPDYFTTVGIGLIALLLIGNFQILKEYIDDLIKENNVGKN